MARPNIWDFYNWVRTGFNSVIVSIGKVYKTLRDAGMGWLRSSLMGLSRGKSRVKHAGKEQQQQFQQDQAPELQQQGQQKINELENKLSAENFLAIVNPDQKQLFVRDIIECFTKSSMDDNSMTRCLQIALLQVAIYKGKCMGQSLYDWDKFNKYKQIYISQGDMSDLQQLLQKLNFGRPMYEGRNKLQEAFDGLCNQKGVERLELIPQELRIRPIQVSLAYDSFNVKDTQRYVPTRVGSQSDEETVKAIIGDYNYGILEKRLEWLNIEEYRTYFYMMLNLALTAPYNVILPVQSILRSLHVYAVMKKCSEMGIDFSEVSKGSDSDPVLGYINGSKQDMKEVIKKVVDMDCKRYGGPVDLNTIQKSVVEGVNTILGELCINNAQINDKLYLPEPERYGVNQLQQLPMNKFFERYQYPEDEKTTLLKILESPRMLEVEYQKRCGCVLALYHVLQKENQKINTYPGYKALKVTEDEFKAGFMKKSREYLDKNTNELDTYLKTCINDEHKFSAKVKLEIYGVLESAGIKNCYPGGRPMNLRFTAE